MTLTRSTVENPNFNGASAGGVHVSSANRVVTAGRLQLLLCSAFSDLAYPDLPIPTNTFGFTWVFREALTLESSLNVEGYPKFCTSGIWFAFCTVTAAAKNTVDFGTIGTINGGSVDRGSLWTHWQIAGFLSSPVDDGLSLMPQDLKASGADGTVTVAGLECAEMALADPLQNAESLHICYCHTENGATQATVVNPNLVLGSVAFPRASAIVTRNQQSVFFTTPNDVGDTTCGWDAYSFEVSETPVVITPPVTADTVYYDQLLATTEPVA